MKRRKNALRQAGLYLLLFLVSPFICAAAVRALPSPVEALSEAAVIAAGVSTETISETFSSTEAIETRINTFRIITDDSFIKSGGGLHIPSSRDEESDVLPEEPIEPPGENPAENPDGNPYPETDGVVDIVTYGKMSGGAYIDIGGGQIQNMTALPAEELLSAVENVDYSPFLRDGTPEILIYHTHATESYLLTASDVYDTNFPFRSTDIGINMVAVGNAITEELEAAGFGVIHDTTLFDEASYNGSYEASRAAVKQILSEYPTIKVVLDIHRDALQKSDNEIVAPTVTIGGEQSAQIMLVSNCTSDELKYPIPNYRQNLNLAVQINTTAESLYPGLMRPILFDYRQYNQDLSPGALLVEVGGHGNSLPQAIYAGHLFGRALGETF